MRFRLLRLAIAAGLIGLGGTVLSGPGSGCASQMGESGLVALDFCFIFDCEDGLIDPCAGVTAPTGGGGLANPLFTDCYEQEP